MSKSNNIWAFYFVKRFLIRNGVQMEKTVNIQEMVFFYAMTKMNNTSLRGRVFLKINYKLQKDDTLQANAKCINEKVSLVFQICCL